MADLLHRLPVRADDVVFVSSDGYLLEGPTSTLILRRGNRIRTPRTDQGILAGTTQADLFDFFEAEGFEFHGRKDGLERDCRRYTELVMNGWRVLRYTWDDVLNRPEWVLWTMQVLVAELAGTSAPPQPMEERRAVPA